MHFHWLQDRKTLLKFLASKEIKAWRLLDKIEFCNTPQKLTDGILNYIERIELAQRKLQEKKLAPQQQQQIEKL